ncbi:unnamed protein product, partial [Meganyctiphanes norvegica]
FKLLPAVFLLLVVVLHLTSAQLEEKKEDLERIFYASSFTTTFTDVSILTSIIPYTCYTTAASTKGCKGRKKRRSLRILPDVSNFRNDPISPSMDDLLVNGDNDDQILKISNRAAEKFFFTVWKTSVTSLTVTSYSTNRSITLSINAACTHAGFTTPIPQC